MPYIFFIVAAVSREFQPLIDVTFGKKEISVVIEPLSTKVGLANTIISFDINENWNVREKKLEIRALILIGFFQF